MLLLRHTVDAPSASTRSQLENLIALRERPRLHLTRVCLLASMVRATCAHRELCYSSLRDYVRAGLGVRWSTFCDWACAGDLFRRSRSSRDAYLTGAIPLASLVVLARRLEPVELERRLPRFLGLSAAETRRHLDSEPPAKGPREGPDSEPPASDSTFTRLRLRVPADVALYLDDTLELARALLGHDAAPDACLAAVVAEASTDLPLTVSTDDALRRFPPPRQPIRRSPRIARAARPLPLRGHATARRLHRHLRRLLRRVHVDRLQLEDALLRAQQTDLPGRCGFVRFDRFCREVLRLAPSTAHDHLRRAHLRRRQHPIAVAVAEGRLTPVQADLLTRLHEVGVATSALDAWIELAPHVTTRRLRQMVEWAARRAATNYSGWCQQDFRPPSDEELRTTGQSPREIAQNPDPPGAVRRVGIATRTYVIDTDVLTLLLRLMASQQDSVRNRALARGDTPGPMPDWWALLRVVHAARRAWAQQEPESHRHRAILDRDAYHCAAPECTQRQELEVHHIVYRSHGGSDDPDNLVTLCHYHHHHGEHAGRMRVRGKAQCGAEDLTWQMDLDRQGQPARTYRGDLLQSAAEIRHRPVIEDPVPVRLR